MGWTQEGEWYDSYGGDPGVNVRDWCPSCDPDGVPEPYMLRPCSLHQPSVEGSADKEATGISGSFWLSGSMDPEGTTNAKWCNILHRGRVLDNS